MTRTTLRTGGGVLLLLAAAPVGALVGLTALLTAAAVTHNRVVAGAIGAITLSGAVWTTAWVGTRLVCGNHRVRLWVPTGVSGATLALVGTVVTALVFVPGLPPTEMVATDATRYWTLSTGSRIAYTHAPAQGTARPAPVIVVHGGPGAPRRGPHPATAVLNEIGYDVYEYHQTGAGLSERLEDIGEYTVRRAVADLEAIRDEIGADRVTLVGESWGATLIANYLSAHPRRVAAAVVAAPGPIWPAAFPADTGLTVTGRRDQDAVLAAHPRLVVADLVLAVAGPDAAATLLPPGQVDGVFESLVGQLDHAPGCAGGQAHRGPADPPAGYGFWANAVTNRDAANIPDPRPRLRNTTVPVLVLRGQCDYIAWEVAREYRDVLPEAVLLAIDDAGHLIALDQPELYRRALRSFLLERPLPLPPYTGAKPPWREVR